MKQYINLVKDILKNGTVRDDRTGTGTKSFFGRQLRFNLEDGFPACTSKKLAWKAVVAELLWILEGSSNEHRLAEILRSKPYDEIPLDKRRTIWTDNFNKQGKDLGYENGDLGPVYGHQWRHWNGIDQIQNVIDTIKNNPFSRRHIICAWNPAQVDEMALPPCHAFVQFYVSGDGKKLSCQLYQRSADIFLGVPFNIASYATLLAIMADVCGYEVGDFVHTFGDAHIYLDHVEQVNLQLSREPRKLPKLIIKNHHDSVVDYKFEDFEIVDYDPHPAIKGKVSV